MKFIISLLCLSILFFYKTQAQNEDTLLNHSAPAIVFQNCLDKKVSPDFYKGKILVLDFWATWCAPCIASFPHFNALAGKFASNDIVFAAITAEHTEIANKFFKRTHKQLNAFKLIDTSRITQNSFKVITIPHCVVIDRNNMVKWEGETYNLTEDVLDKIIKNEPLPVIVEQKVPVKPLNKPIAERALFSFIVAISDTTNSGSGNSVSSMTVSNSLVSLKDSYVSIAQLLEKLTGYGQSTRIITNDRQKLDQFIDIEYNLGVEPSLYESYANTIFKNDPVKNFTISLLGNSLGFDTKVITAPKKHYELVVADSAKLHSFMSMQSGSTSHSSIGGGAADLMIAHYNLKDILTVVESYTNTILLTQIPDNNYYDLSINTTDMVTLNKSLLSQGLKIIEKNNEIEMLSINFR